MWVEDLGSTNGTFVNGSKIEARTRLRSGDVLRIGQTELRVE
jgi:pSer/pThr/pTyr-binding forkhead associated (FHA) protein